MKKALRVATVFTGVIGCAATFAPTAPAAAAAPGTAVTRAIEAASIESGPCDSGTMHRVHVYDGNTDSCVGFRGTLVYQVPLAATGFCPGSNYGYIEGDSLSPLITQFRQGSTIDLFPPSFEIASVHISGWNGDETCPAA
jgi:hypothetical protein